MSCSLEVFQLADFAFFDNAFLNQLFHWLWENDDCVILTLLAYAELWLLLSDTYWRSSNRALVEGSSQKNFTQVLVLMIFQKLIEQH